MNETFEDQLAGLTPEQVNEAVAIMDELGAAREAMAIVEGHVAGLLAQLGALADAQAAASKNSHAGADARRSLAAQVAIAQGVAPGEARAHFELAERLQGDYPETLAALQEGSFSLRHAEQVVRAGAGLDADARAELDRTAVELAPGRTSRQLGRLLTKRAVDLDERTFRERHAAERARRHVYIRDEGEGMSTLMVYGPTLEIRAAYDILSKRAGEIRNDRLRARRIYENAHGHLPEQGWTAPVSGAVDTTDAFTIAASDVRSLGQIRTDLLLDTLLTAEPTGHQLLASGTGESLSSVQATVHVTIPVAQLIDPNIGAGWMDDGTLVPPDTLRILAGNSPGWERIFFREDDGSIEKVDHYRATAWQRRIVGARDMTCRVPGCDVPSRSCDIDHGLAYSEGGETHTGNLESLCPAHHQMKHQAGWKVRQVAGGVIEFTTPLGHVVTDEPMSRVFFQDSAACEAEQVLLEAEHAEEDLRRAADELDEDRLDVLRREAEQLRAERREAAAEYDEMMAAAPLPDRADRLI
ncbi:hypothetical protein GCM10010922_23630 [Microbacterium sorbitolivorans]|uniref:HNH endonuclease n=1 Tax=Microbacterium sorbitolivorans TaxID=1867410 RepID=A0A367XTU5_9MICO|nr:HNH endonuclease signature motif containing protein [Microbacterium sorbitolivorans]RCK57045.1 HNH endonuclease [Microbacterium sorbitolivorans]GGF47113.1 hypothetical protein GCM10010922_23630 [Microbacterium sorbitolivorans]